MTPVRRSTLLMFSGSICNGGGVIKAGEKNSDRRATRLARQNMHDLFLSICCTRLSLISCIALFFFSKLSTLEIIC
jgi:hypothetical protein